MNISSSTARLQRTVLSSVAGLSVVATVLLLVALPSASTPKTAVHLPSGQAANAAFVKGLAMSGMTTSSSAVKPSGVSVAIKNYAFSPATLSVGVGSTVTWTNDDTAPHTVTVSSGPVKFASPTLQKGDTYSFTFTTPGTYSYYCAVHPSMTGSVVVTGSTSTPTATPTTSVPTTPTPTPTSTGGMPMPSGDSECAVSGALQTFLSHVNSAHLAESPGQQVQDILDLDSYIGNHLVLVERMLSPLTDGGLSSALSSLLSTFLTHVNSAHLDESPAQQVQDISDVNSYIGNHLVLVQHMLAGVEGLTC
ncbi:MAG TPA: cupredoxin family copper-binding protein [Jatrophihabitantaceae bacterium]|nr:cupredoxin family copper-binding protein [Jatrophihabitantaceae bacterium]